MAKSIRESEVKNRICKDFFGNYDWTPAVGDIDLTICSNPEIGITPTTFLWAETKKGKVDPYSSLIQLILTIGKARTFEREMPPFFLGAADSEKIAFIEYNKVMQIFSKNDFNWNVVPSDHSTKEFSELYGLLHEDLSKDLVVFSFAYESASLKKWITKNFKEGRLIAAKIPVNKNNFTFVYYDWVKTVKPSISFDWDKYAKKGVLDCDFYLADLMSNEDISLHNSLKVVLEKTKYKILQNIDGMDLFQEIQFSDKMVAYRQFWNRYQRPPKRVYQKYILDRRDLLVPQNIREVKGSYYTPEIWVRKAQEYLARYLGENWQEEYYIWDCCAGSGNLLRGLTNKYNIFASTIDDSDVKVMHDAIDDGRLNLVKNNVFQFDFLNDDFSRCPSSLKAILDNDEKRRKLVIFINPPYAETANKKMGEKNRKNKQGVSFTVVQKRYGKSIGIATKELSAQFFIRIKCEITSCVLAEFSTLKILQGPNFNLFRTYFNSRFLGGFMVPADTFDNVKGAFPIGFMIWDTQRDANYDDIVLDVFNKANEPLPSRVIHCYSEGRFITDWFRQYHNRETSDKNIGAIGLYGSDFQHANFVYITNPEDHPNRWTFINAENLIQSCMYMAARICVPATWINDREQFLWPNESVLADSTFQADCLVFCLFSGQNRIVSNNGINHWIPFYEEEVHSPQTFNSRFMADFIHGRIKRAHITNIITEGLFSQLEFDTASDATLIDCFSPEAFGVFEAGKALWAYYMSKPNINANASFLEIRGFFQGFKTTPSGETKMNSGSSDLTYSRLLDSIKIGLKALAGKIEEKIYQYGFLIK